MRLISVDKAKLESGDTLVLPATVNYCYIYNDLDAQTAVSELLEYTNNPKNMMVIDIETDGIDPYTSNMVLLQAGLSTNVQYIFDIRRITPSILFPVLESNCWKVGHNLKFDAKFLICKYGIKFNKLYDTFLAEKVIRGGVRYGAFGYGLDEVLKHRLGKELKIISNQINYKQADTDKKVARAKKFMQHSFINMGDRDPDESQLAYAAQDASIVMFELVAKQINILCQDGNSILYDSEVSNISDFNVKENYERVFSPKLNMWDTAKLEFKFLEVVIDMELAGMGFSKTTHDKVMEYVMQDYNHYRSLFLKTVGKKTKQKTLFGTASINPDSSLQVQKCLGDLGIKLEDTLSENLEEKLLTFAKGTYEYEILEILLKYRDTSKLVQTFGSKLAARLHPVTNRIHFEVEQVLETGRISNRNPNIQQVPAKIEWRTTGDLQQDANIETRLGLRECFVAKPGHKLVIFDYSSQELRVAASVSRDSNMIQAFIENKELHIHTASLMYDIPYDELVRLHSEGDPDTILKRKEAKTGSFGAIYGSGAKNLAKTLRVCMERAREIIEKLWSAYPELKKAMTRFGDSAVEYQYSNTIIGRRRFYGKLVDNIRWTKAEKSIGAISKMAQDAKLSWVFEKEGEVTPKNIGKFREALIKKHKSEISRKASNHVIQGTSADMLKKSAVDIRKEFINLGLDAKIIALVHDEIIVECKEDVAEICKDIITEKMKQAMNFFCPNVPAAVSGKISDYWTK